MKNCFYCQSLNKRNCCCQHKNIECCICKKRINSVEVSSLYVGYYENHTLIPWEAKLIYVAKEIKCINCDK